MASVLFAGAALVGCGDDDGGGVDSGVTIDAGSTADAKSSDASSNTPTHSGTVGIHEISLHNNANAGRGLQINVSFNKTGIPNAGDFTTGTPVPPCSATLTDVTVAAQNPAPVNEGTVSIAVSKMGGGAGTVIPPCNADATGTYRCVSKQGTGGTLATTANQLVFKFTDTTATPNAFTSVQVGHYLIDTSNGKAYPVVGASGATLAIQAGTGAAAGSVGPWIAAAGIGPIAFAADPDGSNQAGPPDFLANTDSLKVTLATVTGSGNHFTYQSTGDIAVGDDFELDVPTTQLLLDKVPLGTADVTFGCSTTGGKACSLSNAQGIIVVIDSTDATTFAGATDLGKAVKYTGNLTCAAFDTKVVIPKAAFAVLKNGNPTRLRISVFRDAFEPLVNSGSPKNTINVVAGHGIVAFQTQ